MIALKCCCCFCSWKRRSTADEDQPAADVVAASRTTAEGSRDSRKRCKYFVTSRSCLNLDTSSNLSTLLCFSQAENDALEREKELSEALERQRLLENVSSTIICAVLSSQEVLQF